MEKLNNLVKDKYLEYKSNMIDLYNYGNRCCGKTLTIKENTERMKIIDEFMYIFFAIVETLINLQRMKTHINNFKKFKDMNQQFLSMIETLDSSWSARVKLKNNIEENIWYTCWSSIKHQVSEIISISSDFPRHKFSKN